MTPAGAATRRAQFFAGVRAELPILVGVVPFGLIYGVTALAAGLPADLAVAMSAIVFAGSSQFIGTQLIGAAAPATVIVLTTLVVNLRHLLYSASVAPYVRRLPPGWRALLAYLLTDECYAVTILHYRALEREGGADRAAYAHWYYLGAGLALWSTWQASTVAGVLLGAAVPPAWGLDVALPLTFIALLVPALRDRADVAAAVVAGAAGVLFAALPFKLGLVLAAFSGIAAGLLVERRAPHRAPEAVGK